LRLPFLKYTIFNGLGPTLGQLVKEGVKLTLKDILIIGLQLLDRLEGLHKIGVVYRRLTLSSIMFGQKKGELSHVLHLFDYTDSEFFN
jgi:hypothetical protein